MFFIIVIPARGITDVCDVTGVLNSVRTMLPCYLCTAIRDQLHDFQTRFPLRHNALIAHHVSAMRELLQTGGVAAMEEYSNPISDRHLPDVHNLLSFAGRYLRDICQMSQMCHGRANMFCGHGRGCLQAVS
jgi:hypothetical protein